MDGRPLRFGGLRDSTRVSDLGGSACTRVLQRMDWASTHPTAPAAATRDAACFGEEATSGARAVGKGSQGDSANIAFLGILQTKLDAVGARVVPFGGSDSRCPPHTSRSGVLAPWE